MINHHFDVEPYNWDRRARAMISLLQCPPRWSSKAYVQSLARSLILKCMCNDRQDLAENISNVLINI
jgi:hypothetical protein